MQNFKGMLAEFYDQASMLLGLPDISFSPIDFIMDQKYESVESVQRNYCNFTFCSGFCNFPDEYDSLAGRENLKCRADRIGYHFSAGTS